VDGTKRNNDGVLQKIGDEFGPDQEETGAFVKVAMTIQKAVG